MGDSNTTTVSTELGDVIVRKMALNDYAELLRALNTLPGKFGELVGDSSLDFKNMDNAKFLSMAPGLIADSWSDLIGLIAVPTDWSAEDLGKLDGADAIDVIVAIFELNDFARVAASVKKLSGLRAKIAPKTAAQN